MGTPLKAIQSEAVQISDTQLSQKKKRKKMSPGERREAAVAYLLLSPALLLFVTFIAGPLIAAIVLSLFQWDLLTPARFNGLGNYFKLFTDSVLIKSLLNTFVFTFWSIVLHIGIGLLLALAVNRAIPSVLKYFLRTTYFFPLLISWASVALLWKYALDPSFGFINYYLKQIGITPPNWLIDAQWAMPSIIFVDLWKTLGFIFIILLAGLQGIPAYLYEAARIDGANVWKRFWHITIPSLSPTLFFSCITAFIGAFQIFEPMYIMTQGGPNDTTKSIVQHIYEIGFRSFEMGYAATISLIVFVVIMIVTLAQMLLSRYWVHYD